ncbi:SIR2 family protein, partial [Brevibacterium metallidurans]
FSYANFSNLNYDTLLLAALMAEKEENELRFVDLFDGREEHRLTVPLGFEDCLGHPLRGDKDHFFERTKVRLAHLHGSATYWQSDSTSCVKLSREVIKDPAMWRSLRMHEHEYRPCVVLTNSRLKRAAIEQQPFDLAYTKFAEAVHRSSRWLVIGYSFRDEPVNDVLRSELHRRRKDDDLPQVLVVSHGKRPTRPSIELALGWTETDAHSESNRFAASSDTWLKIDRDGAFGLQNREVWAEFVDSDPEWPESSEW